MGSRDVLKIYKCKAQKILKAVTVLSKDMKHFFNSHEPDIITKLVYVLFVFNKHSSLCFD